eukprot:gene14356-16749_t
MVELYGEPLGNLKGKTVRRPPPKVATCISALDQQQVESHDGQKPKKGRFAHINQASPFKTQNDSPLRHDAKVSSLTDFAAVKSPKR